MELCVGRGVRQRTGRLAVVLGALLFWVAWAGADLADSGERPNIVVIMADDFGYEGVSANGSLTFQTPELDAMAAEGVRYLNCHAQPICTPSRVRLMTGITNARNYVKFGVLDPGQTTFANLLQDAGYATMIAGKWQLSGGLQAPYRFGFDEYCLWQLNKFRNKGERYANPLINRDGQELPGLEDRYGPDVLVEHIIGFMDAQADRQARQRGAGERVQPFLVYYPMVLPHDPFTPTPDSPQWQDPAKRYPGSRHRGIPKHYPGMVSYLDKIVGRLLAALEQRGLAKNTLVIFTGDNGTPVQIKDTRLAEPGRAEQVIDGGKSKSTDNGTRVPLIVRWPAQVPGGRVLDDLFCFSDVLPTICAAAGVPVPAELGVDGVNHLPRLKAEAETPPRSWIDMWYSRTGKLPAKHWVRTDRYKLYAAGGFYHTWEDPQEERPLTAADPIAAARSEWTHEAQRAHRMLSAALAEVQQVEPTPAAAAFRNKHAEAEENDAEE